MSTGEEKTTGVTPAEYADQIQGIVRGKSIDGFQAAIATAILGSVVVDRPSRIRGIRGKILVCGASGQTDVDVKVIKAGATSAATVFNAVLTVDNADPDGTEFNHTDFVAAGDLAAVEPGDVVYLEVTAAPGSGTGLHAQVAIDERYDPPVERPLLS